MTKPSRQQIAAMEELGFTRGEAEVYLHLAQESPATGYRIAQALGKPAAQIYRTLESLERKGGLIVHDGGSRLCRPVQIQELASKLQRDLDVKVERAIEVVRELPSPQPDTLIYSIQSRTHLFERARAMLSRCQHVALLDLFPRAVEALAEEVGDATDRGVSTLVKIYKEADLNATRTLLSHTAETTLEIWPGEELTLVVDAREFITARLSKNGGELESAFWSENQTLAGTMHNGLICEIGWNTLEELILANATRAQLLRATADIRKYVMTTLLQDPDFSNIRSSAAGNSGKSADASEAVSSKA